MSKRLGEIIGFKDKTSHYAVCGTSQGLMVTQITEAPRSARRTKQLFTAAVLPRSYSSNEGCSIEENECLSSGPRRRGTTVSRRFFCGPSPYYTNNPQQRSFLGPAVVTQYCTDCISVSLTNLHPHA